MTMRRLLLISYHFPPSNEVAGKPTARLVRHLPTGGWEAVVVTIPADDPYVVVDPEGYADVLQATRVERIRRRFHPFDALAALSRLLRACRPSSPGQAHSHRPLDARGPSPGRVSSWDLMAFIRELLAYPDVRAGWLLPALWKARRLLSTERFDAIMTVSPPHSACLIGLLLKSFGLPLITQFHDPWVDEQASGSELLKAVTRRLEAKVVAASDLVLNATEEATAALAARNPRQPRAKFATLHNGFDPADFSPIARQAPLPASPLRLTHAGSLYGDRTPFGLFAAVAQLAAQGSIRPEDLQVRLIGDCLEAKGRSVEQEAQRLGVSEFVRIEGPVSYPASLAALAESDVLLLLAQNQPLQVPAKLFDYLHLRKTILAFTSGASRRLINETGRGIVIDRDDVDQTAAALCQLIERKRRCDLRVEEVAFPTIQKYLAASLAQQLAGRLDHLVAEWTAARARPGVASAATGAAITHL